MGWDAMQCDAMGQAPSPAPPLAPRSICWMLLGTSNAPCAVPAVGLELPPRPRRAPRVGLSKLQPPQLVHPSPITSGMHGFGSLATEHLHSPAAEMSL